MHAVIPYDFMLYLNLIKILQFYLPLEIELLLNSFLQLRPNNFWLDCGGNSTLYYTEEPINAFDLSKVNILDESVLIGCANVL